jgi:putative SOS response-associated peptidase YedK
MCGRYKMTAEQRALFDLMPYLEQDEYFDIHGYKLNGDICPGTFIMAVNNRLEAEDVWWTVEDEDRNGVPRRVINAKAENVRNTPMFREAFARDRILVPATGIYEWQLQPDGTKKKFDMWFDEPVFAMAGVARDCEIKGERRRCAVILTTRANGVFDQIHNTKPRQPVVIHRDDHERWLDPATPPEELEHLMEPVADEEVHYAEVPPEPSNAPTLFQM